MHNVHDINGLVFWTEPEIMFRRHVEEQIVRRMQNILWHENQAWCFEQTEGSVLIPHGLVSPEYADKDIFVQQKIDPNDHDLVLRPETTSSSYAYARGLFDSQYPHKPPLCVWQIGKSFRREQDQPTKFMRLKEFWQLEFQCIYTDDTKNDYRSVVLESLVELLRVLMVPERDPMSGPAIEIVPSDRVPSYATSTLDIEVWDRWAEREMEVCSASIRTDFPGTYTFDTKKGPVEKKLLVLEIALGLDRIVYQRFKNGG